KELRNRDLSICQIRPMFNSQCSILTRGSGYADRRSARLTASFRGHQDSPGQYKGDQNGKICVGAWCVRWSMDLGLADGSSEGGGTFGGSIRSARLGGTTAHLRARSRWTLVRRGCVRCWRRAPNRRSSWVTAWAASSPRKGQHVVPTVSQHSSMWQHSYRRTDRACLT